MILVDVGWALPTIAWCAERLLDNFGPMPEFSPDPILAPMLSSLLAITLASVKLSSGTLKRFLPFALPWEPGSVRLAGKVQKNILRYKIVTQPTTTCNRFDIKTISFIINRPLSGTDAVQQPNGSKT